MSVIKLHQTEYDSIKEAFELLGLFATSHMSKLQVFQRTLLHYIQFPETLLLYFKECPQKFIL